MTELLDKTEDKIEEILWRKGSVTLHQLETTVDAAYNLLFLALDRMTTEQRVRIEKGERDYILSIPQKASEK